MGTYSSHVVTHHRCVKCNMTGCVPAQDIDFMNIKDSNKLSKNSSSIFCVWWHHHGGPQQAYIHGYRRACWLFPGIHVNRRFSLSCETLNINPNWAKVKGIIFKKWIECLVIPISCKYNFFGSNPFSMLVMKGLRRRWGTEPCMFATEPLTSKAWRAALSDYCTAADA